MSSAMAVIIGTEVDALKKVTRGRNRCLGHIRNEAAEREGNLHRIAYKL